MAKVLDTNLGNRVDQAQATQPILVVDIYWGVNNSAISYADKDYLFNSQNEPLIRGKIIGVTGLDSTIKLSGSNSSSISITLDDADNSIRDFINANNVTLVGRKVVVKHCYDDLNVDSNNTVLLFIGLLSSPVTWGNRTISFNVLSKLEDKEVGFSAEQGQFDFINEDIIGRAWPLAFGSVKFIPAIKINNRTVGHSMTQYSVISHKEYKTFKELVQEYIQLKRTKDRIDTDRLDPNKRKIWCSDDEYEEMYEKFIGKWSELLNYYNNLVAQKPESNAELKQLFDELVLYWDKFEEIKELKQEFDEIFYQLANEFSDFNDKDRPLNGQNQVVWQQKKDSLQSREFEIKNRINVLTPEITQKEELIETLSNDLTRFGLTTIKVFDGKKFPQSVNTKIMVNGLVLKGQFNENTFTVDELHPTYTDVVIKQRETDDPNVFWLDDSSINLKNQFIFIKRDNETNRLAFVKDQDGDKCVLYQILLKKTTEDPIKYEPILLDENYTIYQTSAFTLDRWFSWADDPNKISLKKDKKETGRAFLYEDGVDFDFDLNMGDAIYKFEDYFDTYVANCVPSSNTPASAITEVCAYRNIKGEKKLCIIPKKYYRKYTDVTLDQLRVTAIEMIRPLTSHKEEGWEEDVYISISGGVFGNSSYDAIDVLIFLITKYSTLTYDSTSFTATRSYVTNMIPNFLLSERRNIISLLEDIAWQCKCVVWVHNNIVYIKSLAHQTADVTSLTESDILDREISYTDDADIITILEAKYRKWYLPDGERSIVLRNNIPIFGKRKSEFDFFIYTDEKLIEHIATFWLLRYSNIWKRVKFKTPMHTLRLDVYDQVGITLTDGLVTSDNSEFHALIESTVYDITNFEISYDCWIPIRMQENTQYLWAFTGDQVQLYPYPFPGLDNYPGGSASGYNISSGGNFVFTTRPKDYGTQFPADFSLTAPVNQPTFGELDYSILKRKGLFRKIIPVQLDIETEVFDKRNGAKGKLSQILKVARGVPGALACEVRGVSSEGDLPFTRQVSYLTIDTDKPVYSAKVWQPADNYLDTLNPDSNRFHDVTRMPLEQLHEVISTRPSRSNYFNSNNVLRRYTGTDNPHEHYYRPFLTLSERIRDNADVFLALIRRTQSGDGTVPRALYGWDEAILRRDIVNGGQWQGYYAIREQGRNSDTHGKALNLIEVNDEYTAPNPFYNYYGNGVKRLTTSPFNYMRLQPVGGGAMPGINYDATENGTPVVVIMYRVPSFFLGTEVATELLESTQYVFQYENGISGTCPPL